HPRYAGRHDDHRARGNTGGNGRCPAARNSGGTRRQRHWLVETADCARRCDHQRRTYRKPRTDPTGSCRSIDETINRVPDERTYPQRPYLAVSAAIFRERKVLVVRRARKPALNLYTFPGGAVEAGEALANAIIREVREETSIEIEPIALAGHREVIARDPQG